MGERLCGISCGSAGLIPIPVSDVTSIAWATDLQVQENKIVLVQVVPKFVLNLYWIQCRLSWPACSSTRLSP